jgi:hypothetical protein
VAMTTTRASASVDHSDQNHGQHPPHAKAWAACPEGKAHPLKPSHYFGLAVSSTGVAHVIWGEADGSSLYCCGDVWYTKGF